VATVLILLRADWRNCLVAHAKAPKVAATLRQAVDVSKHLTSEKQQFSLVCDDGLAGEILVLARKHCPDAVREIEKAIQAPIKT
jgi:hypothetical protein